MAAVAASLLLVTSLGACSSGGDKSSDSNEALPPVLVAPSELAGNTFEVTKEQPLVINVEDPAEVEAWSGDVEAAAVAVFTPGYDDGSAQYNPSFEAVGSGETDAWVTSPDGELMEFTIKVP